MPIKINVKIHLDFKWDLDQDLNDLPKIIQENGVRANNWSQINYLLYKCHNHENIFPFSFPYFMGHTTRSCKITSLYSNLGYEGQKPTLASVVSGPKAEMGNMIHRLGNVGMNTFIIHIRDFP